MMNFSHILNSNGVRVTHRIITRKRLFNTTKALKMVSPIIVIITHVTLNVF